MAISYSTSLKDKESLFIKISKGECEYYLLGTDFFTYRFAKPLVNGKMLVFHDAWDIVDGHHNSIIYFDKNLRSCPKLKAVFNSIRPRYGYKLKGYVFGDCFIVNVDFPKLMGQLKVAPDSIFNTNFNVEDPSAIAVYNLKNQKLFLVDDVGFPGEGMIPIKEFTKKWGFITIENLNLGNINSYAIIPVYDFITGFVNGYSKVKKDNSFGYINKAGDVAVPIKYDDAKYNFRSNTLVDVAMAHFHYQKFDTYSWEGINLRDRKKGTRGGIMGRLGLKESSLIQNCLRSTIGLQGIVYENPEVKKERVDSGWFRSPIDPVRLDFDLTQFEIDYMSGKNSLLDKYGQKYKNWEKACSKANIEAERNRRYDYMLEQSLQPKESNNDDIDGADGWERNID